MHACPCQLPKMRLQLSASLTKLEGLAMVPSMKPMACLRTRAVGWKLHLMAGPNHHALLASLVIKPMIQQRRRGWQTLGGISQARKPHGLRDKLTSCFFGCTCNDYALAIVDESFESLLLRAVLVWLWKQSDSPVCVFAPGFWLTTHALLMAGKTKAFNSTGWL
jgi:hypothetical protein